MTAAHRVVLYTRSGCSLCVTAAAELDRICGELGHSFTDVDVDAEPALQAEYGDRVPVVLVDGREHSFWRVDEPRLRKDLA